MLLHDTTDLTYPTALGHLQHHALVRVRVRVRARVRVRVRVRVKVRVRFRVRVRVRVNVRVRVPPGRRPSWRDRRRASLRPAPG